MSKAQFTPGPWRLVKAEYPDEGGYVEPRVFSDADPDNPQFICSMGVRDGATEEANGYLVAAAPEMYAALKEVWELLESGKLVRDISRYAQPGWALEQRSVVRTLASIDAALAKAVRP